MTADSLSSRRRVPRLKVVRPLLLWLLFVTLVTPVAYHRRNYPNTRLNAYVAIDGVLTSEIEVRVGSAIVTGTMPPPLGPREITISAADCEPFTTNRFIWYGTNSLGFIDLFRKRRPVALSVTPPALRFFADGPYQRLALTNISETNLVLAVGTYQALLHYGRFSVSRQFKVVAGAEDPVRLRVGTTTLVLASDKQGIEFRIRSVNGSLDFSGKVPAELTPLPVEDFTLEVRRGDYLQSMPVKLVEEATNTVRIHFPYGSVRLDSNPAGSQVRGRDGVVLGSTPFTIDEVRPGETQFFFDAPGYLRQSASANVRDGLTEMVSVRLHSLRFAEGIDSAQRRLNQGQPDLEEAYTAAAVAVREEPDSVEAKALLKEIMFRLLPARAEASAAKSDFSAAVETMTQAVELAPDHQEFRTLRARYVEQARSQSKAALAVRFEALLKEATTQFEARQFAAARKAADNALALEPGDARATRLRAEIQKAADQFAAQEQESRKQVEAAARLRFPEETFAAETAKNKHAELFDTQQWSFKGSLPGFISAVERAFKNDSIKWEIADRRMAREDTWIGSAKFTSVLTAPRAVVIVASEQEAGDIVVRAKFWVYSYGDGMKVGADVTPMHPKFYRSDEPARSRQKCREVVDGFKATLDKEMK